MKIHAIALLTGTFLLLSCNRYLGDDTSVTTYTYAEKNGIELKLDVYMDSSKIKANGKHPVLIFSYGGAWATGKRSDGAKMLAELAEQGVIGVGIDYRLEVQRLNRNKVDIDSSNFVSTYRNAILIGIEDLFDATSYVIDHADEWNADTSMIVACGSSAGAINSLTAEYMICNGDELAARHLPQGFNYAAVVSFAGGIWVTGTDTLVWQKKPCPILAYHGTSDQLVPYDKKIISDGSFAAFGPGYLAPRLTEMEVPYMVHTYNRADHVLASLYNSSIATSEFHFTLTRMLEDHIALKLDVSEDVYDKDTTLGNFFESLRLLRIK